MAILDKRRCVDNFDGSYSCYRDGFWHTDKGVIIKWCIFAAFVLFFMAWFVGGYIHAKKRMKKGLPLLGYHRWLVPYNTRRKYGQVPQNHFTFYATQQQPPYGGNPQYQQRPDGTWPEPPPMYNHDAPPGYYAPPGATKVNPNQGGGMEMPHYGSYAAPPPPPQQYQPQEPQQFGVVGSSSQQQGGGGMMGGPQQPGGGPSSSHGEAELPERPPTAKTKISGLMSKFRR